ncbi:MAG: class I SAM-dependent methyltransferase [Humidesulfovibrio sp.]|uniref:class I SAM-dependent methyltransferase n=1 Tax=Humidesulfovibrio sp. TaxID=2910988 RepID=UPI0027F74D7A|nr:class I SAM-dependent methyltransferase [Humidesulfovibrio sp.]MDQ7834305.1 class I SAM-dependent methyltransferase [Humidesulfovibrio sp.]
MQRLLIWGTGGQAGMIMSQFPHATHDVVAFVDNNSARQGSQFHGKPVISPEAAAALSPGADFDQIAIASAFFAEIRQQALSLGIPAERIAPAPTLCFACCAHLLTAGQLAELSAVPWWHHRFEILPGVVTPGVVAYKPWLLGHSLVADLKGQRALDIGAWDGPYTLEMARRGASVTGFDIQPATHSGFDAMRRVNNLDAGHICANVYNLNPEEHGTFDLVTFFGVYYHLKDPLLALSNINRVLNPGGLLLVEGAILEGAPQVDAYWAGREDVIERVRDIPMGYFVRGEYEREWSNWWVPNLACLRHWVESSGFKPLEASLVELGRRGYVVAQKISEVPLEHIVLPPALAGR